MLQLKNQQRLTVLKKITIWQIIILIGLTEISFKKIQLLLTATNLITRTKLVDSNILTLKTWLMILEIIQLVKYLLKRFKYIKPNKKCGNNKT